MDVDILLTVEVDFLLPRHGGHGGHGGASIESRAYSKSDEIGISHGPSDGGWRDESGA